MKAEDQLWALGELVAEHNLTLDWGIANGCRCMSCRVYVLSDIDGRVCEAETLEELIEAGIKHFSIQV